jgi:hypothetical protein
MIAHRVAAPVLEHVGARGVVAGVVRTAAYLDFDGFVVAVTARAVPLMPNGISLTGDIDPPAVGRVVHLTAGGLQAQGWSLSWPEVWDPSVPRANGVDPERVRQRGEAILRGAPPTPEGLGAIGVQIAGHPGVAGLLEALRTGEPPRAGELLGLGSGLTPEGDDLLAGAAAAVASLEPWDAGTRAAWLAAAAPPEARARTTALSATLLDLAGRGQAIEPLHALLDLEHERWAPALERLVRLGHSTGRCYAAAVGAAAVLASRR